MTGKGLGFLDGGAAVDDLIDEGYPQGMEVNLALRSPEGDPGPFQVLSNSLLRMSRHKEQSAFGRLGLPAAIARVGLFIEAIRFSRLCKGPQAAHKGFRERLEARLPVLGPFSIKVKAAADLVQVIDG